MNSHEGNLNIPFTNYLSPKCVAFVIVLALIWFVYILGYSTFVFLMGLSPGFKNLLWYIVAFSLFLIAVLWLFYRRAKSKSYTDDRPSIEYTRGGSDPRIGETYRWSDDDPDKRKR